MILPCKENMGRQPWCFSLVFGLEKGRMQGDLKVLPVPKGVPRELEMDLGQGMKGQGKAE